MGYRCVNPPVLLLISACCGVWESKISFVGGVLGVIDSAWGGVGGVLGDGEGAASGTGLGLTASEFGDAKLAGETFGLPPGLIEKSNGEAVGADVSGGWVMELVPGSGVAVASWA